MSSLKEIKSRLKSVESILQITKAMKLVASSRIRRVENLFNARAPYTKLLGNIFRNVFVSGKNLSHPFFDLKREIKSVGILAISGDKGLCGAYNSSVIKQAEKLMHDTISAGKNVVNYLVGSKIVKYYNRRSYNIGFSQMGWTPDEELADKLYKIISEDYLSEKIDVVYVISGQADSRSSYFVTEERLLPFAVEPALAAPKEYLFEPGPSLLVERILPQLINQLILTKLTAARFAEYVARIIAMTNASENADNLVEELRINYFRARQSAITTEILEVTAAAAFIES